MSCTLFWKRIERRLNNWLDPYFDGDRYRELNIITAADSDFYEFRHVVVDGSIYSVFLDLDDESRYCLRRLELIDGEAYYTELEDETEIETVRRCFVEERRSFIESFRMAAEQSDMGETEDDK